MQKSIVWEGLRYDTEEHCAVNYLPDGIMVRSEIEGWADAAPVYAEYTLHLSLAWEVLELDIHFTVGQQEHHYHFTRNEAGWTDASGGDCAGFGDCRFADISLTPFTNTLAINGLDFTIQDSHEISVLYIDVLEHTVSRKVQRYTKTDPYGYFYENADGSFNARITTNDDGFVTDYPNLFEMLKPH